MKYTVCLFLVLLTISCGKDDSPEAVQPLEPKDYTAQNETEITEYLVENDLVSQKSETGLDYIIEKQGDGLKPDATSNVTVFFKGYFLDGTVFEENTDDGITADLAAFIPGWVEGISYFNEGGKGVLLIPAHLGYGSSYFNGIPPGSVLLFDIELFSVN